MMIKMKKLIGTLIALIMFISNIPTSTTAIDLSQYYIYNNEDPVVLTEEQLKSIIEHNMVIDEYVNSKLTPYLASSNLLSVPLFQQTETNYCGPACTQMVVKYKNGQTVSQNILANQIGVSQAGCSADQISACLNNNYGLSYEYVNVSNTTFENSLIYRIDADYPLICNVSQMPSYTSSTGHFIVATGYYAGFSGSVYLDNVYYNDPHYNNDYFGSHVMTKQQMLSAISSTYGWY